MSAPGLDESCTRPTATAGLDGLALLVISEVAALADVETITASAPGSLDLQMG